MHEGLCQKLSQVQDKSVNLSALIQEFSPVVYNRDQLSFTTVPLPECILPIKQKFVNLDLP